MDATPMDAASLAELPAAQRGEAVRALLAEHGLAIDATRHPDQDREAARLLVERMHSVAAGLRGDGYLKSADAVAEGASLLDAYQAGLVLATPHPATGYVLVKVA
jgi:hypothetical protein